MAYQDPRFGLFSGWTVGESGWGPQMDANLLNLSRFGVHLSIKSRVLTAPPVAVDGDTYIPAVGSTGAWVGLDGKVVVYTLSATWAVMTPRIGWVAYIEDEEKLSAYKATGWSAGIAI